MLPSWFRRPSAAVNPDVTTCIYNTDLGLFALSWRRDYFGRSLHLRHHHHDSFHLRIKSFPFHHTKKGSRKLNLTSVHKHATISWDLSGAKFGSGSEPISGFYIAIVVDGEVILLVGDSAYSNKRQSAMILRREHVRGTKSYSTKAKIGGRERKISMECRLVEDPRLYFSIDDKKVLQIKHLNWKFRGSERVEIDGDFVQVSWDVYKWLFHKEKHKEDGYALFMFDVFTERDENVESCNGMLAWGQQSSIGMGFEEEKKKKKGRLLWRGGRNSSFSSFSSANSSGSCSSSVMEWADNEDDEFMDCPYSGFSLHVYAWRT